jgi:hypothetical protein
LSLDLFPRGDIPSASPDADKRTLFDHSQKSVAEVPHVAVRRDFSRFRVDETVARLDEGLKSLDILSVTP